MEMWQAVTSSSHEPATRREQPTGNGDGQLVGNRQGARREEAGSGGKGKGKGEGV